MKKKNTSVAVTSLSSNSEEISQNVTALPVVSHKLKKQTDLLDRLVSLSNPKTEDKPELEEPVEANEDEETNLAETYRWEWSNPELAQDNTGIRPSDIKQAILQEKTPEVIAKVIAMAETRDEWGKTISQLNLDSIKLVKQIALNAVLLEKTDNTIKLGLRSAQKHLITEKSVEILQQTLTTFYACSISLSIDFCDDESLLTPLDYRRQIYHELSEQAKQNLLKDKKIKLLQDIFDAKLDMDSIRPV
ncbi:DNA polymerase III subunit gamma/tau [Pasteurella bettyae]|nr:DNA polymerase III subunit gamma/tau [Pasteurella bettyae]